MKESDMIRLFESYGELDCGETNHKSKNFAMLRTRFTNKDIKAAGFSSSGLDYDDKKKEALHSLLNDLKAVLIHEISIIEND